MKKAILAACLLFVPLATACGGDPCADAAEIVERCLGEGSNTNGSTNGGVTTTATFDENECKDSDAGEDVAKCIVDNESTICGDDSEAASGQFLACALGG